MTDEKSKEYYIQELEALREQNRKLALEIGEIEVEMYELSLRKKQRVMLARSNNTHIRFYEEILSKC